MNRTTAEAKWKALRGHIKETWGDLTDDDLDRFDGQRDQFVGHIQERYGMSRADVERRLVARALEDSDTAVGGGRDFGEEALARRRERHATAGAVDELLPELELQLAQALAHA